MGMIMYVALNQSFLSVLKVICQSFFNQFMCVHVVTGCYFIDVLQCLCLILIIINLGHNDPHFALGCLYNMAFTLLSAL